MSSDKRNGAIVGGGCCASIALLLAIWQPITFIIYLPLFLASFILAIVAIAQKRITSGVLLLILSIILPIGAVSYGVSEGWKSIHQAAEETAAPTPLSSAKAQATSSGQSLPTWEYNSLTDEMGRGESHIAWITSTNSVNFAFPYAGPQHARLALGAGPKGMRMLLQIERGQFLCHSDGCTVNIRIDDGKIEHWRAAPSADGSTTTLFIPEPAPLIRRIPRTQKLRVEAEFYQEGSKVFTFDVAGLDLARIDGTNE